MQTQISQKEDFNGDPFVKTESLRVLGFIQEEVLLTHKKYFAIRKELILKGNLRTDSLNVYKASLQTLLESSQDVMSVTKEYIRRERKLEESISNWSKQF